MTRLRYPIRPRQPQTTCVIRTGGDRRHADLSAQKEHRLGHHNRRPGVYHQLAHYENLLDTRKNRSHRFTAARSFALEKTPRKDEGRSPPVRQALESHIRSTRRQVLRVEIVEVHRATRRAVPPKSERCVPRKRRPCRPQVLVVGDKPQAT